jgi:hypothetical protein
MMRHNKVTHVFNKASATPLVPLVPLVTPLFAPLFALLTVLGSRAPYIEPYFAIGLRCAPHFKAQGEPLSFNIARAKRDYAAVAGQFAA